MEEYYDGVVAKPEIDELYHHGVLGMHWRQRNGPPYPLGSDISTGHRLKSGAAGSVSKTKKKLAKASVKAAKANKKAAQASNSVLHPIKSKHKDELQTKAFKQQAKADRLNAKVQKMENKEAAKLDAEMKKLSNKDFDGENTNKLIDAQMKGDSKSVSDWIDSHTKTRETKDPEGRARFGEIDHNGNIIRTQKQMMDETIYRTMQAQTRKTQEAADSNQDMFNDMLDRTSMGGRTSDEVSKKPTGQQWKDPNVAQAEKDFKNEIKRVAKESGVNKRELEAKVIEAYQKRQEEIRALDAKRQEQKQAQEHRESINRRLQNAKTRDQWDLGFLEAVQNEPWAGNDFDGEKYNQTKMLQEYKKYLEDPEAYWKNR